MVRRESRKHIAPKGLEFEEIGLLDDRHINSTYRIHIVCSVLNLQVRLIQKMFFFAPIQLPKFVCEVGSCRLNFLVIA